MNSGTPAIPAAQVNSQLEKILAGEPFRDSPTLQRLLTYLVAESLGGRAEGLKEYSIGTSVFQRAADFDPRTDSIVRVQMGVLRKKLALYYSGAGARDELILEIPRGHYAPAISPRPVSVPTELENEPRSGGHPSWSLAAVAAGAVLLTAAGFTLFDAGSPRRSRAAEMKAAQWTNHPVWKGFFEPGNPAKLVVGVPFMFAAGGMMVRDPSINNDEDLAASARVTSLSKTMGLARPCEVYTGLGEAAGINLLTRFFASASQDLTLIRSRLAKWQDLATGNAIFLSSARFRTLDKQITRPVDFEFVHNADKMAIHIRNPRPGEESDYVTGIGGGPDGSDDGTDYALVSVWPGTLPGRRIISMGGTYTWGTEGAAEYLTDGPSLSELKDKLAAGLPAARADHGLQIILKVVVKNNQVASTSYVTHHWLR